MAESRASQTTSTSVPSDRILTADLLIADQLIKLPDGEELSRLPAQLRDKYARLDEALEKLFAAKSMREGDKFSINAEEFKELSVMVAGLPSKVEPGGSSADILTTLKHLRGANAEVDYMGIAGTDSVFDNLITDDLKRSGIRLNPGETKEGHCAISFIFTHPDGKRTNITYPGNAADLLKPQMITDERIAKSNSVMIPISLWSKFDNALPETLLAKSLQQDKQIIVTMPKQARFEYRAPADIHQRLIPYADIIVTDEEELGRLYNNGGDLQTALQKLEIDMLKRDALRTESHKSPRSKPVTAFVKHSDDSVTLLAGPDPRQTDARKVKRYHLPAPVTLSGQKHALGVDDAMYAGFIAALQSGMDPDKAAEYAISVGQTKFLYDTVRIPSPIGADVATQKRWQGLRSGLGDTLAQVGSAISYAQTGVANPTNKLLPRTPGQLGFDLGLYPMFANIGVWLLSFYVTYHSNFNQDKSNWFVKRSDWCKEGLAKLPMIGKSPRLVRNLNMIIWSFVDGTLMAPVVAIFESQRQRFSRWIDKLFGTEPKDTSVYDKEVQRSWKNILGARFATFIFVIATYFTLNTEIFKNGNHKGILIESPPSSGTFEREPVTSVNGFVFDLPAKKIGGFLNKLGPIHRWAERLSNKQLSAMAKSNGAPLRSASQDDVRYQIEGLVNTGLFEFVYTSLCTAGLYLLGKTFARWSHKKDEETASTQKPSGDEVSGYMRNEAPQDFGRVYRKERRAEVERKRHPVKTADFRETVKTARGKEAYLQ